MKEILLITGKDCHLCSEARFLISKVQIKDYKFKEVDIYSKRDYVDKYWDKIPVILNKDYDLTWPFNSEDIRDFLIRDIEEI